MAKNKKRKSKFKGKVSRNIAKQARGTQYGHLNLPKGISVFKEDAGSRVSLDIIPYIVSDPNHPDRDDEYEVAMPGEQWYRRPYKLHRNIGANSESVICPTSIGLSCPICEHRAQLLKEGADWDDEAVKALKSSARNLYVVIPKGSKKYDEKVHVWDIAQYLFQNKLNEEIQEDEQYENFPDLEEGYTLRIRFSEEQLGTNKFADTSRIDFIERDEPYDESILEDTPCLDDVIEVPSYKTVEALFFGGLSREEAEEATEEIEEVFEGEEDEEEEEPRRPRSRRSVSKSEPDDDDADDDDDTDDDDDADDDEEEEEKPKLKKAEKKSSGKRQRKAPSPKTSKKNPKKSKENECPHGHRFGKDYDEKDECDNCEVWETCMDAS